MSDNKTAAILFICVCILLCLLVIAGILNDYHNKKLELEKYRIDTYLKEIRYSIKESHVFYVPDKHQIIVILPEWININIDPNKEIIDINKKNN